MIAKSISQPNAAIFEGLMNGTAIAIPGPGNVVFFVPTQPVEKGDRNNVKHNWVDQAKPPPAKRNGLRVVEPIA